MTRPDRLLSELHGYASTDGVEAGHRQRMVQLLAGTADVFSRGHLEPGHFTASCVIRKLRERSPH